MLDSVDNNQNGQGDPDLSGAGGNQQFLREWDQYQDHWLASAAYSERQPILLPISVDIDEGVIARDRLCLLYTSPSPRDATLSRMPSSA